MIQSAHKTLISHLKAKWQNHSRALIQTIWPQHSLLKTSTYYIYFPRNKSSVIQLSWTSHTRQLLTDTFPSSINQCFAADQMVGNYLTFRGSTTMLIQQNVRTLTVSESHATAGPPPHIKLANASIIFKIKRLRKHSGP